MNITYSQSPEGYLLPDLALPDEPQTDIGRFGRMRLSRLKSHRRVLYINLLTSCELHAHLCEIAETANARMELIVAQMVRAEGVTERLKAADQMLWVQKMNSIRNRAMELIRDELIYC